MMIVPVFILLWTTVFPLTSVNGEIKCCNSDEQLIYSNSTEVQFECAEKSDKRLDFFANSTDLLKSNKNGICYDVLNSTFYAKLDIRDGKLKYDLYDAANKVFRKCCPINLVYNTRTHGCVKNTSHLPLIVEGPVSIGLPECRIIRDVVFNTEEEQRREALNSKVNHCTDRGEDGKFVLRTCQVSTEICKGSKCVRKCCPDGQSFVNGSHCEDNFEYGLNLNFSHRIIRPEDPFSIVHKYECSGIHILNETNYDFILTESGMLDLRILKKPESRKLFDFDSKISYCIEHAHSPAKHLHQFLFFMCFMEYPANDKYELTKWSKFLSCVGLLLTIAVYLILDKVNNLFGKSLICYCFASLGTFVMLLISNFEWSINLFSDHTFCFVFAYMLLFFIYSQFLWLNILCWDIWNTFGFAKTAIISSQSRKAKWKKFSCYNLYAWGLALILVLNVFTFNTVVVLPYSIHPFIGHGRMCFLERRLDNYARLLFKDIPLLMMEIANVILFVKTVRYCFKVKNEIRIMNDNNSNKERNQFHSAAKEKLLLIFKLSIIMGVFLLFEVVSGFTDMSTNPVTKYIEIGWDIINTLQGVFIFIIFVCKKVIYSELLLKCGIGNERKVSTTSMTNC